MKTSVTVPVPVENTNANSGVFYIYVTDRRKASSLANYQNMINIISSTRSSNVRNKAYNALKEKAEIEDFRGTFY